jgi:membrane-bound serine protease (ClpP class)
MDILLDPNIAYLLLAGGLIFTVLAVFNPGTGLLEISALFALLLSGWSIYNFANQGHINWWALLFIFIGFVLFVVAVRRPSYITLRYASIAAVVLGSAFLFRGEAWWIPAVNPFLASIVGVLSGGFFWVTARKVIEAESLQPTHDLEALMGAIGEAKTEIHDDGSVQVAGELWSARSEDPISEGTRVRVVEREGFILKVEALDLPGSPSE